MIFRVAKNDDEEDLDKRFGWMLKKKSSEVVLKFTCGCYLSSS